MAGRVPRCIAALLLLLFTAVEGACPGADAACAGGEEEEAALLQQSSRQAIAQSSSCDMSGCQGCSGEQCQLCRDDKAKECCLDQFCRGCSGEQCTYCREDHMAGCCAGKHPGTPGCSGPSPTPSPPACDTSGCQGCSGEQCQLCVDEKQKDCCLDQACRGCSGEQCTYCREDHMAGCCAGKHPGTPGCSGPSPTPSPPACDTSGCQGCSGEQCQLCMDEKQKDCCLDQACRGCSGEQCTYCREDHMAGDPWLQWAQSDTIATNAIATIANAIANTTGTCGNPDILCYWEPDCVNGGLCCKADGKTNECKFCGVGSCGVRVVLVGSVCLAVDVVLGAAVVDLLVLFECGGQDTAVVPDSVVVDAVALQGLAGGFGSDPGGPPGGWPRPARGGCVALARRLAGRRGWAGGCAALVNASVLLDMVGLPAAAPGGSVAALNGRKEELATGSELLGSVECVVLEPIGKKLAPRDFVTTGVVICLQGMLSSPESLDEWADVAKSAGWPGW
ncbi:unnamed protein product [Prorocentrum cordatum]|uniref:Subtilisin n=1 Tax=Prorocentrum cordatum TaxID=2364126 RepID=A0ABN9SD21_9DINO|nr:unnamed protein product [Polarella glacialis]